MKNTIGLIILVIIIAIFFLVVLPGATELRGQVVETAQDTTDLNITVSQIDGLIAEAQRSLDFYQNRIAEDQIQATLMSGAIQAYTRMKEKALLKLEQADQEITETDSVPDPD